MARIDVGQQILIERPSQRQLDRLKVFGWPIWAKEPSTFEWCYDEPETCYFLEGDALVKTDGGEYSIGSGDFVTFPQGLRCTWQVKRAVRKHYHFGKLSDEGAREVS